MDRTTLILSKLSGQAPEMPWPEVFRRLLPWRLGKYRAQLRMLRMKRYLDVSWADLLDWTRAADWRSSHNLAGMVAKQSTADGAVLWKTPLGEFWGRSDDDAHLAFETLDDLVFRAYERGPVKLRQGDIVLDCGGHLGTFTRYALSKGAQKSVIFEPDLLNVQFIRKSFSREIMEHKVELIEAALSDKAGEVYFEPCESAGGSVKDQRSAKSIAVKAVTIDEVARELPRVDFIKMDIEGAERVAVVGAKESIRRWRPRMALCTYHLPDDTRVIPERVLAIDSSYKVLTRDREQAYFYV